MGEATTDGNLNVAEITGKGYEPLRRYQVAETQTWAHPAIMNDRILVKDVEHLILWSL